MIHAYAASSPGAPFTEFSYDPGPLGIHDVEIAVDYCGICHSDLSMWHNDWGITQYPFVPGHEVAGRIAAVGAQVVGLEIGDRVGLGWHAGYCNHCSCCLAGDHNLCAGAQGTIVARHGGFADKVRAQATSVVKIPAEIPSEAAGPLFCGGITVFNPLVQYALAPTARVGVIGIGGLGHMALQFLRAWGCEVTAFTSSEAKKVEALALGAHRVLDSRDISALKLSTNYFDLIISTVNVSLDWAAYLETLHAKGRLHFVGAVLQALTVSAIPLISAQRSISGSPVGSPAVIQTMLDFAVRHSILPRVEVFALAEVNRAMAYLAEASPRYRVVLRR